MILFYKSNDIKIKHIKNILYYRNNIILFSIFNKNYSEFIRFVLNELNIPNKNILFNFFFLKTLKNLFFIDNFNKKTLKNSKIFFLKFKYEKDFLKFFYYYIDNKINMEENNRINMHAIKHKNIFINVRETCISKNALNFLKKEIVIYNTNKLCNILLYYIKLVVQILDNFLKSHFVLYKIITLLK